MQWNHHSVERAIFHWRRDSRFTVAVERVLRFLNHHPVFVGFDWAFILEIIVFGLEIADYAVELANLLPVELLLRLHILVHTLQRRDFAL